MVRAGAVRPGRDDDEVDGDVPGGADRRGDVGGDLGLGAPGAQPLPHPRRAPRRSPRRPRRSAATSAGDLRIRSSRSTSPASRCVAPGSAARRPRTCSAHIRSARPTAATGPSRAATTSGYGSVPSRWSTMRTPGRRCRGRLGGRAFEPGHDEGRLALGGQHQAGQPLPRVGVVAGEVPQVGAGREQQGVQAGGGGRALRGDQPIRRIQLVDSHPASLTVVWANPLLTPVDRKSTDVD